MKHRALTAIIALMLASIVPASCTGTPSPPVDSARNLDKLVMSHHTLEQVQAMMTPRLQTRVMLYPALNIEKSPKGNWLFKAKPEGKQGDTDAPFLVLVIVPDRADDDYYAILFQDNVVMATEWFPESSVEMIRKALTHQLEAPEQ